MTVDEARELLMLHAEGRLEPEKAQEVEAVLSRTPELQAEYNAMKEENFLIQAALQPLRPSQSTRFRLSEAMADVYEKAAKEAEKALAEKNRRMVRAVIILLLIGTVCILAAGFVYSHVKKKPHAPKQNSAPPAQAARSE